MSWPQVALGEICELKYGRSLPEKDRVSGGVAVYGSNGKVGQHNEAITDGAAIIVGRKGSIGEVNLSNESCWPIDTTYFVDQSSTNQNLRWLAYALRNVRLGELNKATGVPGLNRNDAYEKKILLPSLDEQKRIAAILDQAEELRRLRQRAIDHLNQLGQSIFYEMFRKEMASLTGGHGETLGKHIDFVTSGGRGWAKYYASSGARFIRSFDVQMNRIGTDGVVFVNAPDNAEAERTKIKSGDVLLTITGSKIGRVAPATDEFAGGYISQHVAIIRVRPGSFDPDFLSYFLSLPDGGQRQIRKMQYGQAKPGLNFEQIRSFKVAQVALPRQKEFRRRLAQVGDLTESATADGSRWEYLFTSLQHRAFRGEL